MERINFNSSESVLARNVNEEREKKVKGVKRSTDDAEEINLSLSLLPMAIGLTEPSQQWRIPFTKRENTKKKEMLIRKRKGAILTPAR